MEEFYRQLGVIKDLDKKKVETNIDILHLVLILIKLAIMILLAIYIMNIIDNNIDKLMNFISEHDSLSFVDSNELSSGLYLTILMFIIIPMMLLVDIIDLVINRERPFEQLLLLASINYCFQLIGYTIYTDYNINNLLIVSLLEPLIYLCLICVVYVRVQYNNKVYHQMLAKEQQKYKESIDKNINLSKDKK